MCINFLVVQRLQEMGYVAVSKLRLVVAELILVLLP